MLEGSVEVSNALVCVLARMRRRSEAYPNANVAVSQNLLTKPSAVDGAELALQDRASLEAETA